MLQLPVGRAFLPLKDPLINFPAEYGQISEFIKHLPEYYTEGTIREKIRKLPDLPMGHLEGELLEAVMRDCHFILNAYYHACGHKSPGYFPSNIARMAYYSAAKFGKPAILSYCSYALNNWRSRFDEIKITDSFDLVLKNVEILRKFTFTRDEEWFVLIHIVIEGQAVGMLKAMQTAFTERAMGDPSMLEDCLIAVALVTSDLCKILSKMKEQCDPKIYASQVRIPIQGFTNIVYEGVPELKGRPVTFFLGETGAQSSIVPSLDAFLDIKHEEGTHIKFLDEHRYKYTPPNHRKFVSDIKALSASPQTSIRERVKRMGNHGVLKAAYNDAVSRLADFRDRHYQLFNDYIASQIPAEELSGYGPPEKGHLGTGGTFANKWLKKLHEETLASLL